MPSFPAQTARDTLASTLLPLGGDVQVRIDEVPGRGEVLVVQTSQPREVLSRVPVRQDGFLVRVERTGRDLVPRGAPPAPACCGPASALVREDLDAQLWTAIEQGTDPLFGRSFDQAVATAPECVEALIHQRIHQAFHVILGLPQGMRGSEMGNAQRDAYLLRARTYRARSGGTLSAADLAESLRLNWEEYSQILQYMGRQARTNPAAAAWVGRIGARAEDLSSAFSEAGALGIRAYEVALGQGREGDAMAWNEIACIVRNMKDFTLQQLALPVPGAAGARALPAGEAPVGMRRRLIEGGG